MQRRKLKLKKKKLWHYYLRDHLYSLRCVPFLIKTEYPVHTFSPPPPNPPKKSQKKKELNFKKKTYVRKYGYAVFKKMQFGTVVVYIRFFNSYCALISWNIITEPKSKCSPNFRLFCQYYKRMQFGKNCPELWFHE